MQRTVNERIRVYMSEWELVVVGDLEAVALGFGVAAQEEPRQVSEVIAKVYCPDQMMICFFSIPLYRHTR